MAQTKSAPKKLPLRVRTHTLSRENDDTLRALSQDASDLLGWTVSGSAVVRALLRYAEQQHLSWARSTLFPLIEQEIAQGRVWGSKK